jgi:cytosine/uracil/thiamine/allantoin permease
MSRFSASKISGIVLTVAGLVLLSVSAPALVNNPDFTYGYTGGTPSIDQLFLLMLFGALLLPFGILFIVKSRKGQGS